jgi:hypothetical protein
MAPNYLSAREMPLTLAVDPGCLHCHASGAASSLPDARNHYAGAPFANGGITCAACHGDGERARRISGKSVLWLTSTPWSRSGATRSASAATSRARPPWSGEGRQLESFSPGDNLFDYALFFVRRGETGSGGRATSQWEALLKSACKQGVR